MQMCFVDNAEHCIFCNAYIPEGRQVCPICEAKLKNPVISEVCIIIEDKEKGKDD